MNIIKDDPELDYTDFAHPAWWRGYNAGAEGLCLFLTKTLDGKDPGNGMCGSPQVEALRRKIIALLPHDKTTKT